MYYLSRIGCSNFQPACPKLPEEEGTLREVIIEFITKLLKVHYDSWVVSWWMASIRADCIRAVCRSRMALGKPVVPEE